MNSEQKNTKIWTPIINYTTVDSVNKAIDLAKKYNPSIYVGVESLIVNPSRGGDGRTKGYVTNRIDPQKGDESKIIYIFTETNKKEAREILEASFPYLSSNILNKYVDKAMAIVVANTIVHEKAHIEDELKSGESPADNAEKAANSFFNKEWDKLFEEITKENKTAKQINNLIKLTNFFSKAIKQGIN